MTLPKQLPKAKGAVSRKLFLDTGSQDKHIYSSVKKLPFKLFRSRVNKEIVYNEYIQRIIKGNGSLGKGIPGILGSVNLFYLNKNLKRYIDPKDRFEIIRVSNFIKEYNLDKSYLNNGLYKRGNSTKESFYIQINSKEKTSRFYLKESKQDVIVEYSLLNYLKKYLDKEGIGIIKPHFAFKSNNKAFIVYEFSNLLTLKDALNNQKITRDVFLKVLSKIKRIDSILPEKDKIFVGDVRADNCFIEINKDGKYKLYLFDLTAPFNKKDVVDSITK